MRKRIILLAALSLVSLWVATGIASAQEAKVETKTVTGVQVELSVPADGLKVGENNVSVRMKEAATGQAVVREIARVDLAMDEADKSMNHGSMSTSSQKPAVFELKAAAGEQGRYEGKISVSDPGDWNLRVFTDSRGLGSPATFKVRAEKASTASAPAGSVATSQASGPSWIILGGLALVAAVVVSGALAAFKKSSNASKITPTKETTKA